MPIIRIAILISIFLGAVACSSSPNTPALEEMAYASMLTEGTQLADKFEDYANEIPVIPTKGTATYKGIANLNRNGDGYADITLTADFAESAITGRMDNFTAPGNVKINGYADITHGKMTGRDFAARLSGDFDGDALTGDLGGRFYGKNAEVAEGNFRAEVRGQSYLGEFIASK